ncbi:MAG: hypothetical protein ACE5FG_15435 [Myxococcota bacterium]
MRRRVQRRDRVAVLVLCALLSGATVPGEPGEGSASAPLRAIDRATAHAEISSWPGVTFVDLYAEW